jgi:hypothetical protein
VKLCPTCSREFPDNTKFCPVDGTTLRAKAAGADLVGQVVADRYHITRKLGEGGMGAVYLGEHVKMGRKSAIKVMAAAMAQDPDAISRFNREAANASRISHPNVCQIYDFGETPEGLIYLAMEFIEGEALTDLIDREGALHAPRAASILKQAADALQAAHDLGIVHRDIKPDNIMILAGRGGADVVKVVDFGIARAVGGDESGQKVTKTGLVVGTPEYMSPEQLSGDKLDGRSDLYSLGLVLYRMLTGVLPFQADSAQETMIKRLTDEPTKLADSRPDIAFPDGMQQVLDRALARDRDERYQSAGDFGTDTMAAVAGMDTPQTRVAPAAGSAATQLLDEAAVRELTTKQKAAGGRGPAAPARPGPSAAPPAPARRTPVAAIAGTVVGLFGVAAVAIVLLNKGDGVAANRVQPDTVPAQVATQPLNPDTTRGTGSRNGGRQPGPGQQQQVQANPAPDPRPPTAVNWVAIIEDSANAAVRADQSGQTNVARRIARWVYYRTEATAAQKADMAELIATTYENDTERALEWVDLGIRYASGAQLTRLRNLRATLGGTP